MLRIMEKLCPESRYGLKCPYMRKPSRVVIHNTGNDAPAENEVSYMINRGDEISFHYAVDDQKAVQGLPEGRNAWASGDGRGIGNIEGIHIEICYSKSGGSRFEQAEKNAAELTAGILKRYGWGLDKVTKHQDYDGKYCPHRTLDLGWERFLRMVEAELDKEEEKVSYEQFIEYMKRYEKEQGEKSVSGWAEKAVKHVKETGAMVGDGNGKFRPQSPVTRQELAQVLYNLDTRKT